MLLVLVVSQTAKIVKRMKENLLAIFLIVISWRLWVKILRREGFVGGGVCWDQMIL